MEAKYTKILHRLQTALTKVSGLLMYNISFFYQVIIAGILDISQLRQFWNFFQEKLFYKRLYAVSKRGMSLRLPELQENNQETQKLRKDLL